MAGNVGAFTSPVDGSSIQYDDSARDDDESIQQLASSPSDQVRDVQSPQSALQSRVEGVEDYKELGDARWSSVVGNEGSTEGDLATQYHLAVACQPQRTLRPTTQPR